MQTTRQLVGMCDLDQRRVATFYLLRNKFEVSDVHAKR